MLDFAAVSDIDLSASNALSGFILTADRVRTRVVLSAASEPFATHLRETLPDDVWARLVFESDLDHALERCEDMLLAVVEPGASGAAYPRSRLLDRAGPELEQYLERLIVFEEIVDALAPWLEPRTYAVGEALDARGGAGECLHFLVEGPGFRVRRRRETVVRVRPRRRDRTPCGIRRARHLALHGGTGTLPHHDARIGRPAAARIRRIRTRRQALCLPVRPSHRTVHDERSGSAIP